jgi:segregation and condensation protein B
MSDVDALVPIVEAALLAAGKPLTVTAIGALFDEHERPAKEDLQAALGEIRERCEGRGFDLVEVASGFRFQVREKYATWVGRLWHESPQKYSRALLETLALIAYRQPITRGEIEEIRGVAVSTNIIQTLHEREWIRVVGHRDVPGRPAMYATTRQFLDYFNLKSLDQLPALADIRDLETLNAELGFDSLPVEGDATSGEAASDGSGEEPEGDAADSSSEEGQGSPEDSHSEEEGGVPGEADAHVSTEAGIVSDDENENEGEGEGEGEGENEVDVNGEPEDLHGRA